MPIALTRALDAYALSEKRSRSEAARWILQDWLIGHGFLADQEIGGEGAKQ